MPANEHIAEFPSSSRSAAGCRTQSFYDHRVVDIFNYWRRARKGNNLPGRQHIDPLSFANLWPWVWMVDVTGSPSRFRIRLLGSEHARLLKGQHIGRWVEDVYPPDLCPVIHKGLASAAAGTVFYGRSPGYVRYDAERSVSASGRTAGWLFLPLARDGAVVDMVLGLMIVDEKPASPLEHAGRRPAA